MRTTPKFGALRLQEETLDDLRTLKQAYEICYEKNFTNDDFIKQMKAAVEEGDIAVWETYCELSQKLEELKTRAKQRHS